MLQDDDAGRPLSRTLSLALAVFYVVASAREGGAGDAVKTLSFCIVPLACVWFPDLMGDYTGNAFGGGAAITGKSPGIFVWVLGWLVLLIPIIAMALIYVRS